MVQEWLYATLVAAGTNAGSSVFRTLATQEQALPYIVYNEVTRDDPHVHNGSLTTNIRKWDIDVIAYAETATAADALAFQIRNALTGQISIADGIQSVIDTNHIPGRYEMDTRIHSHVTTFSIWEDSDPRI